MVFNKAILIHNFFCLFLGTADLDYFWAILKKIKPKKQQKNSKQAEMKETTLKIFLSNIFIPFSK